MKKFLLIIIVFVVGLFNAKAQLVYETKIPNAFALSNAVIYVDDYDVALVKKSAELLQQDIEMVIGKKLPIVNKVPSSTPVIIIGTVTKSEAIRQLVKKDKIN